MVRKMQGQGCQVIAWDRIVSNGIRGEMLLVTGGLAVLLSVWGRSKNWALATTSLLALLGSHRKAPCLLATDKSWVAVGTRCVALLSGGIFSNESIKVELALERLVLGLLKVCWDNFFNKAFEIMDFEGLAIVDPRNDFGVGLVLVNSLEHLVEFPSKGQLGGWQVWILS